MKLRIEPFQAQHGIAIAQWCGNKREAEAWAGPGTPFPFDENRFNIWHEQPGVHPFVGKTSNGLVAYGEVWVDTPEQELELARIIVHPVIRNKGVGREFVEKLVNKAAEYGPYDIFLRVDPENRVALRCYKASGFTQVTQSQEGNTTQDNRGNTSG